MLRPSLASIVAKRWVAAVKAGNRRCAVDLRSSLDSRHPPRKRAGTRKPGGKRWQAPGGVAFERVLRSVIHGPALTGAPILDMLGGPRWTPHAALVVDAAA